MSKSFVVWFTGISGAGKSTLSDKLCEYLKSFNMKIEHLDGDVVRELFPQTGFTKEERDAHIKRIGFLAAMLERNDVSVICSFISPYYEERKGVRDGCKNFIEIFVKASVEECERRDVKGLYKKARAGEIKHFTGIDDPYETPKNPECVVDTDVETEEESFEKIKEYLKSVRCI